MKEKLKCPICKGRGEIEDPKKTICDRRKEIVKCLLKSGFGVREVQRLVGYKSPRSVSDIKTPRKRKIKCKIKQK